MRIPLFYFIRKYPSVRFILFFLINGLILGSIIFFAFSTIHSAFITGVYPQIVRPGERVALNGLHFGNRPVNAWVFVGGHTIKSEQCIEWTETKIVFDAPDYLKEDLVSVVTRSKRSNAVLLVNSDILPVISKTSTFENRPYIESLETDFGNVGDLISIRGKNFGQNRNASAVVFTGTDDTVPVYNSDGLAEVFGVECNEYDFDYDYWSDRELRIRVPDAAESGNIVVITDAGISNPVPFRLKNKYGSKIYSDKRMYRLVSEVEVSDFQAQQPNTFFLRIPVPQKTASQRSVTLEAASPDPFIVSYQNASLYRFHDVAEGRKLHIRQEYRVDRSEIKTELTANAFRNGTPNNPSLYAVYTEPDALLPADDAVIKKACAAIVKGEINPYRRAQRIYTYLLSEMTLRKTAEQDVGKSILTAFNDKNGDAYDAALLFCTMARAAGIPAIPTAGLLVDAEKQTVLHWWAEFYLNGFGWVPVDLALASGVPFDTGVPDKARWYFGNLDAYHIAFSRGFQNQAPMLPGGRTAERIRSYAFSSIWEEATVSIERYSSLWRLPKVIGVY